MCDAAVVFPASRTRIKVIFGLIVWEIQVLNFCFLIYFLFRSSLVIPDISKVSILESPRHPRQSAQNLQHQSMPENSPRCIWGKLMSPWTKASQNTSNCAEDTCPLIKIIASSDGPRYMASGSQSPLVLCTLVLWCCIWHCQCVAQ